MAHDLKKQTGQNSKMVFRFICFLLLLSSTALAQDWPSWRGPNGTGAVDADPPTTWSDTENVRWKVRLPGRGHSTPIVVGDRVFVTAAIPVGEKLPPKESGRPGAHDNLPVDSAHEFVVIAINRKGRLAALAENRQ